MNSYMITVKEDNTRQYYVDGISENNAISNYHEDLENGVEFMSNGMDDCMETIVEIEKCGTNIKRNKEGKIINSDELTKENMEHNKLNNNQVKGKEEERQQTRYTFSKHKT